MAEGVVDALEAVQIDEHDAHQRFAPLRTHQRLLQPIHEQHAVGQAGQGVVGGEMLAFAAGAMGVINDGRSDEDPQQEGNAGQQIHPETRHLVRLVRLAAGRQRDFLGFRVELREHGQNSVLRRNGIGEDPFFGVPAGVVAEGVDDPVVNLHGNAGQPSLQGNQLAFPAAQGHAQQRCPRIGKVRAARVELHEKPVPLERVVALGQPEHVERAFAGGGHHGLGEAQLAHVDVDNRAEVVGGHPELLQADGGYEQDQQQLADKAREQRAPPG